MAIAKYWWVVVSSSKLSSTINQVRFSQCFRNFSIDSFYNLSIDSFRSLSIVIPMKAGIHSFFFLLTWMIFSIPLLTHALSSEQATTQLTNRLQAVSCFKAQFTQTLSDEQGQVIEHSHGDVIVMRPGKFKWVIQTPSKQVMVADGNKLWVYDADLEQVTVYNQAKQLEETPALFISDEPEKVLQRYQVQALNETGTRFRLQPHDKDSALVKIIVTFAGNQLKRLRLIDPMEQLTTLEFNHIQQNIDIPDHTFHFTAPRGTDVIDNS